MSPFGPPPPTDRTNDTRAILSLALGALSLVTCGMTGIPAVALGLTARSAIARSRGALGGGGMAAAGIASGLAGTVMGLGVVAAFVAGLSYSSQGAAARRPLFTPSPESTTAWAAMPPSLAIEPMTIGAIRVTDLDPEAKRSFRQQLSDELRHAASAHQTLVLMTSARWCGVCKEFQAALPDARMQAALANVNLVRVNVDDFADELHASGMLEDTLPWFYKVDPTLHPMNAISAGEWDDNVPENMAPVLKSFLAGTLRARRDPSSAGAGTLL